MCTDRLITYKCGHAHSTETPSLTCEHHLTNLKHPPSSPLFALYRDEYFVNVARCQLEYQIVELKFEYNMCDMCELEKAVTMGLSGVRERSEWRDDNLLRVQLGQEVRSWEAYREERLGACGEREGGDGGKSEGQEEEPVQGGVEEEVEGNGEVEECL